MSRAFRHTTQRGFWSLPQHLTDHVPLRTKCHLWVGLFACEIHREPQLWGEHLFVFQVHSSSLQTGVATKFSWCLQTEVQLLTGCCVSFTPLTYMGQHPNTTSSSQHSAMCRYHQVCVYNYVKAHLQVSTTWKSNSRLGVLLKKFQIQDMQCHFLLWAALADKCRVSTIWFENRWDKT